ncbi:MAG: hypothetical protein K9K38_12580 [Rhodoferax sp.]|nr:hypothetical protein [Rhodoferax sp.]
MSPWFRLLLLPLWVLVVAPPVQAWNNHTLAAYRAFERMPEVINAAPVAVESLESFLKAEEPSLEALLAGQEAWAQANMEDFPARPTHLAFKADPTRTDEARQQAFLKALRVAPNVKFALYLQPDPTQSAPVTPLLAHSAVSSLAGTPDPGVRFVALRSGDQVAALGILASACDEPDYGLDLNLWEDSPSEWGKMYGFGAQPFGNPTLSYSSQAPFHMGFMHEKKLLYLAAPFIKRTYPLLRIHQFGTLAAFAFRTGHSYWGWRFAGLALHYVQDLTQPYHASLAPAESTLKLMSANALALAGLSGMKDRLITLQSNRHLALEKYQNEMLRRAALNAADTSLEIALRNTSSDSTYPDWGDAYTKTWVAAQAHKAGTPVTEILIATLPTEYVNDASFDFGVNEPGIDLLTELGRRPQTERAQLEAAVAELMVNFGAHSRNALRGILKAGEM